jgi:hypothetical protein
MSDISTAMPLTNRRNEIAQSGVVLGLTPSSDPTYEIEIQRASTASSSSGWYTIAVVGPQSTTWDYQYTDRLPFDNDVRKYRCRLTKEGYNAGAWSTTLSAVPQPLPIRSLVRPSVWGKVSKSVSVQSEALMPRSTGTPWYCPGGWMAMTSGAAPASTEYYYNGPLSLSPGVTITGVSGRFYRQSSDDHAAGGVYIATSSGSLDKTITVTHSTSGWATIDSTATAELVSSGKAYWVRAVLGTTGGDGLRARAMYIQVRYTMPSYDKSL